MNVLGVIPARGGSKGVPGKNIKPLLGKPLIAWTIESARAAHSLADVIVSTDDPEIARVAESWGARVPFLRPAELAQDDTPGVMTALHAAELLPEFDWLMLLQPTSPMRTTQDIEDIVRECDRAGASAAVSTVLASDPPQWTFRRTSDGFFEMDLGTEVVSRRQDLDVRYSVKGGGVYLAERSWLLEHRTFLTPETYMHVMPQERSLDIDTPWDWDLAEFFMRRRPHPRPES